MSLIIGPRDPEKEKVYPPCSFVLMMADPPTFRRVKIAVVLRTVQKRRPPAKQMAKLADRVRVNVDPACPLIRRSVDLSDAVVEFDFDVRECKGRGETK